MMFNASKPPATHPLRQPRSQRHAPGWLRTLLCVVLSAQFTFVAAQSAPPIADPTAPLVFRPQVNTLGNGVPVVNITAPNAAGMSLNRYQRFDVDSQGVVLNNSLVPGNALLGNGVGANPNLTGGRSASTIINEVSVSGGPSQLSGTIEVFGAPAAVIIANPNGIQCAGCAVLNTPQFTLTTGIALPQSANGQTSDWGNAQGVAWDIQGGEIRITGAGLEGTVGRLDLLGQHLLIDAPLRAHYLNQDISSINLVAGTNQFVRQGNGDWSAALPSNNAPPTTPALAIDASALGAMTAGQIRIISTDQGFGVNLGGTVAGYQRGVQISSSGDLDLAQAVSVQGITLDAAGELNAGPLATGGQIDAQAGGALRLSGTTQAQGDVRLRSVGTLTSGEHLISGGDLQASSQGEVFLGQTDGRVSVAGSAQVSGTTVTQQGQLDVDGDLRMQAEQALLLAGQVHGGTDVQLHSDGLTQISHDLQIDHDLNLQTEQLDVLGNLTVVGYAHLVSAQDARFAGWFQATDDLRVSAGGAISVAGDVLSGGSVDLQAGDTLEIGGALAANDDVAVQAQGALHLGGDVSSAGDLDLRAAEMALEGAVSSQGTAHLQSHSGDIQVGGDLAALRSITIDSVGATRIQGNLQSGERIALASRGDAEVQGDVIATGAIQLDSGGDVRAATLVSGGTLEVRSDGELQVIGAVSAMDRTQLRTGGGVRIGQTLGVEGDLDIHTDGEITVQGDAMALGSVVLHSGQAQNWGGVLQTTGTLQASSGGDFNVAGALGANEAIVIDANGRISADTLGSTRTIALRAQDDIHIDGDVSMQAGDFQSMAGGIHMGGELANQQDLRLQAAQDIALLGPVGVGQNLDIQSSAGSIRFGDDVAIGAHLDASAAQNLRFEGQANIVDGASLQAQHGQLLIQRDMLVGNGLRVDQGGDLLNLGHLLVDGDIAINARNIQSNGSGGIQATGTIALSASQSIGIGAHDNLSSNQRITLAAAQGMNNSGSVQSGESLHYSGGALTNNGMLTAPDLYIDAALNNGGTVFAENSLSAGATSNGGQIGAQSVQLGSLANGGSGVVSASSISLGQTSNAGNISGGSISINGGLDNQAVIASQGTLGVSGGSIVNSGQLSGSQVSLNGGSIQNGGVIQSSGSLQLSGGSLSNTTAETATCIATNCNSGSPNSDYRYAQSVGQIHAGSNLSIGMANVSNAGVIGSGGDITISLNGAYSNQRSANDAYANNNVGAESPATNTGILAATGALNISAQSIDNQGGRLQAGRDVQLNASGAVSNSSSGGLAGSITGRDIQIQGGNVSNQGLIQAQNSAVTINSSGAFSNTGAQAVIVAPNRLSITAGNISNGTGAVLLADQQISLSSAGSVSNAGTIFGGGGAPARIDIQASGGFSNTDSGLLIAGDELNLQASSYTNQGMVGSLNNATLSTTSGYNAGGNNLIAMGKLTLNTAGVSVGVGQGWSSGAAEVVWSGTFTNYGSVSITGSATGNFENLSSGTTLKNGSPPVSDPRYGFLNGSPPAGMVDAHIIQYSDVANRAQAYIGGLNGSLLNRASDASVGSSSVTQEHVPQYVVWEGLDADGETYTEIVYNAALSLALLVPLSGAVITLETPETGTIIGDNYTINAGDLTVGQGVDAEAARQAIADAQNQQIEGGAAPDIDTIPNHRLQVDGPDTGLDEIAGFTLPDLLYDGDNAVAPRPDLRTAEGAAQWLADRSGPAKFPVWDQLRGIPGTINANSLTLNLTGTFTNLGAFAVRDNLAINAAKGIDNAGASLLAGGQIALYGGGLDNRGGTISAGSVYTKLDGDIQTHGGRIDAKNGAWLGASGNIWAQDSVLSTSNGNFVLNAGGDIDLSTARLSATQGTAGVIAGGNITLGGRTNAPQTTTATISSGQEVLTESRGSRQDDSYVAPELLSGTYVESKGKKTTSLPTGSVIEGQSILLTAGQDLTASGATFKSSGDTQLVAGGNMTLGAQMGHESTSIQSTTTERTQRCTDDCYTTTSYKHQSTSSDTDIALATNIDAGGKVQLISGDDMNLSALQLRGKQGVALQSGGNLSIGAQALENSASVANSGNLEPSTLIGPSRGSSNAGSATATSQLGSHINAGTGNLSIVAKGDLIAQGSTLSTSGNATLQGSNVRIEALKDSLTTTQQQAKSGSHSSTLTTSESLTGGELLTGGATTVTANGEKAQGQGNIVLAGATLTAGGATSLIANQDIRLDAVQTEHSLHEESHIDHSGLLNKATTTTVTNAHSSLSEGSIVTGHSIYVQAGQDISMTGSHLVAQGVPDQASGVGGSVSLIAQRDILVQSGTHSASSETHSETHKSGLFSSGGFGITIGSSSSTTDHSNESTRAEASSIQSRHGDVLVAAGNRYDQVGSAIIAAGDVGIVASEVNITEAREIEHDQFETRAKQSGLTISINTSLLSTVQTVASLAQTTGKASDTRSQAKGAAAIGMTIYSDGKNALASASALANGNLSTQDAKGKPMDTASISLSLGSGSSQSKSEYVADTASGSSIRAKGDVSIVATKGDITVRGSDIDVGGDARLTAENGQISLLAASNGFSERNSSSSSSSSVGVTIGASGIGINASTSHSRGQGDGEQQSWTNSHINSGGTTSLNSAGNTTLKGAVVSGNRVEVDVGGDLLIESLQDRSNYRQSSSSSGASISISSAGIPSGSISSGKSSAHSSFSSVIEQSGIKAGDEGFSVNVKGDTELKGGVISSTQPAIDNERNTLSTGTLTVSDIQNNAEGRANSSGFSIDSNMLTQGKYGLAKGVLGNALNNGNESGSSSGQTQSAVSEGVVTITNEDRQLELTGTNAQQTIADLNRDAANAHTAALPQDARAMLEAAQNQQALNSAVFQATVKFSDVAYRAMFVEEAKIYVVEVDKDKNVVTRELTTEEKMNLKPGADNKVHVANNGIFNSLETAAYWAAQQSSAVDGPQYLIYAPETGNVISEVMVAAYQKFLEGDFLGLSNATTQNVEIMANYGQNGLHLDGYSRGAITVGNALDSFLNNENGSGSLSGTTIKFFGPAYNVAQADKTLDYLQGRKPEQHDDLVITYINHSGDPVGRFIGNNPPTGGTVPAGGTMFQSHMCYSAKESCSGYWGGKPPEFKPAIPAPSKEK